MKVSLKSMLQSSVSILKVKLGTRVIILFDNLISYFLGLFQSKKRNIEQMGESVKDSDYYAMQHFISDAPWDSRDIMNQVSQEVNTLLQAEKNKYPVCLPVRDALR